ncbi:DUF998 domain-containing protein [Nocardia sp. NBC_00565]|uniref:DUF998 domain-containing protein n=1 Tax=Nocardia sp. NBC_00565 TaxID=2975993 RepID=UPI002E813378|nr:DUF998 domain-containing protein [Nocardia sp. NBC_00565]WUC02283.1 DUF998 domain-containing protein [Nocardia sp. NBC_00565]
MTRRKTGAALLILASSYYLVESIVAARWPAPPGYSWSRNMISDLGVPECLGDAPSGRFICSPWHALMSAEFVLLGIWVLAAAILLKPLLPKTPLAEAITYLALINCLGNVLVGVFPGSASEAPDGSHLRVVLHPTGAYLELFAGIAIMAIIARLYRAHRGYTAFTLAMLGASFVGMIASVTSSPLGAGAAERLAIDPFVWWRIVTGVVVLAAAGRPATR